MEKLAERLVESLVNYEIIDQSMRAQYIYAAEMLAEKIISIVMVLTIGILMGMLPQAVVFAVFFLALRKYTGGYHAGKFTVCFIESTGMMLIVLYIGDLLTSYAWAVAIMLFVSSLVILIGGTVNHQNMNYDLRELKEASRCARYVLLIEVFIISVLNLIGASESYLVYMSLGVILCAGSMVAAKVLKQEVTL